MTVDVKKVWVIDDDQSIRWVIEKALVKNGYEVSCYEEANTPLKDILTNKPDVIISDIRMPGTSGIEMLDKIKKENPFMPIIIMTAFSDLESTVDSFQKGAYEYITKPFDIDNLLDIVERAYLSCKNDPIDNIDSSESNISEIIGSSKAMQDVYKAIGRIAATDVNVLILGETGTGKELVAKSLHKHSKRADGPFIAINTGSIPTELLESELFGHEKGSFTGAYSQRIGRFEQAENGSLFLDEIGDMPLDVQARLLRILQDGEFYRVGGTKPITSNTRIITATNKNLDKLVEKKLFREDLLHRINVIKIELPTLRERKDDIRQLLSHFFSLYAKEFKTQQKILTDKATETLVKYNWPGNIRQLQNTCKYITIMSMGNEVDIEDLPNDVLSKSNIDRTYDKEWYDILERWILNKYSYGATNITNDTDPIYESILIKCALKITKGKKLEAAKLLGWGRNTITNKMKKL
tara:strand:+ start:1212 stop:2609 length:1398 start_codon:yes stop_codon:yes gene_type:complete